jgi:hypothetical protein
MLYDPKWEKTVKADPFTFKSLIAWLEKQNPETVYCYTKPDQCLVAQYLKAHGVTDYCLDSYELDEKLPGLGAVALGHDRAPARTFGAALARARKALA